MPLIVTVYKKHIHGNRMALFFKCKGKFYKLSLCAERSIPDMQLVHKLRAIAREMFFKAIDLSPYEHNGEELIYTGARFNASAYRLLPEFKAPRRGHEVSRLSRNRKL